MSSTTLVVVKDCW